MLAGFNGNSEKLCSVIFDYLSVCPTTTPTATATATVAAAKSITVAVKDMMKKKNSWKISSLSLDCCVCVHLS